MRWQKPARLAIAVFVVLFAGAVLVSIRQRAATPDVIPQIARTDPDAVFETRGGGTLDHHSQDGKLVLSVKFGRQLGYADGRMKLGDVLLTLPDKAGRTVEVSADEATVSAPEGGTVASAELRSNVRLTTSDGAVVTAAEATYDDTKGMLVVPGALQFTRGRMKGRGVGATYDTRRDVLWLLEQAHITVAAGPAGGGAAEATSGAAGIARADNYIRFVGNARIASDGRTIRADEIIVLLKPDGQTIHQVQLRGASRIDGGATGAQTMSARDIDLLYAENGQSLESARLREESVVELPGANRRIEARNIEVAMAPDGATLTGLNATENVQLDLPPDGDGPAKRIRAASLRATGAAGTGLQQAAFEGAVEYREMRAARGDAPAIDRTATALRLTIDTTADLGAVERADFRGNFRFSDGRVTAEAPRGLYHVTRDRIELSAPAGVPGPAPTVNDGRILVTARGISVAPETSHLGAEGEVRSVFQGRPGGGAAGETRMPALLDSEKPVTVAANRLAYDGSAVATYSGNARLWQDNSKIDGETIVLDETTGNLTARGNVRTTLTMEDVDAKTNRRTATQTVATADAMVYDDGKRLAVYTSSGKSPATLKSAQGHLSGDRIELYLKGNGNELDRVEAFGSVVVNDGDRTARGSTLVYTAADDTYVLTGAPVEIIEREPGSCRWAQGTTLRFRRSIDSVQIESGRGLPTEWKRPCPAEPQR